MNIALLGNLGSGKTTAAYFFIRNYGYIFESLANPMRETVKSYFGIEKGDPRYRRVMIDLGDWARAIDIDVFVKLLFKRIKNQPGPFVVDDARRMNEVKALIEAGFLVLYLDCPLEIRRERCLKRDGNFDESALYHLTETEVERVAWEFREDIVYIDSSGTIEEVNWQLEKALDICHVLDYIRNSGGKL